MNEKLYKNINGELYKPVITLDDINDIDDNDVKPHCISVKFIKVREAE